MSDRNDRTSSEAVLEVGDEVKIKGFVYLGSPHTIESVHPNYRDCFVLNDGCIVNKDMLESVTEEKARLAKVSIVTQPPTFAVGQQ